MFKNYLLELKKTYSYILTDFPLLCIMQIATHTINLWLQFALIGCGFI